MEPEAPSRPARGAARTGVVGVLVAIWWGIDGIVQLAVILLAAWFSPLLVFAAALVVLTAVNSACCRWIDRHWDGWMSSGAGRRMERKLEKMRAGKRMSRVVAGITRGSDGWFAVAAALTNAITAVAVARLIGGQPLSERRILIASASFALFVAGVGALFGIVLGDVIRGL